MTNRIDERTGAPVEPDVFHGEHNPSCTLDDPCLDCLGYEARLSALEDLDDHVRDMGEDCVTPDDDEPL
jgi:hypothetical protein